MPSNYPFKMDNAMTDGVSEKFVYTGIWINWSHGSIKGATITLSNRDGGFLAAFLAIFVTLVGKSFWRLFCFIVHFLLSARTSQDGLYHQRQTVLRNAASGINGLQWFIQLLWNWRAKSERPLKRLLPLITSTGFITLAFYVASIFSSQACFSGSHELNL